jgi:hypothetical protein
MAGKSRKSRIPSKSSKPEQAVETRFTRPASFRAATANAETMTVECTFTSETPVRREGYVDGYGYRPYDEILLLEGMDLSRLVGGPVLDSHNAWGVDSVLGVVETANPDGTATLRFSKSRTELFADIVDGILGKVSVGYEILAREFVEGEGGALICRVTNWRPLEISLVPIPADPTAALRGDGMDKKDEERAEGEDEAKPDMEAMAAEVAKLREMLDEMQKKMDSMKDEERAEEEAAPAEEEQARADGEGEDYKEEAERAAAIVDLCVASGAPGLAAGLIRAKTGVDAVRARLAEVGEIRSLCKRAGVDAEEFVNSGKTLAAVRSDLLDKLLARDAGPITSRVIEESPVPGPAPKAAIRLDASSVYAARNAAAADLAKRAVGRA